MYGGGRGRGGGQVPVPFCILNSSTSVRASSLIAAAAGRDVGVCVRARPRRAPTCAHMCIRAFGVLVSVCICARSAEGAGCYPPP